MIITHLILSGRREGHGFISGPTYFSLDLFWKQRKDGKQSGTLFPADSAEGKTSLSLGGPVTYIFLPGGDMEQDEAWLVSV